MWAGNGNIRQPLFVCINSDVLSSAAHGAVRGPICSVTRATLPTNGLASAFDSLTGAMVTTGSFSNLSRGMESVTPNRLYNFWCRK
jgi:hypothetical protein